MLTLVLGGMPIALLLPAAISDMRTRIVKKNRWMTLATLVGLGVVTSEVLTHKLSLPMVLLSAGLGYLWAGIMTLIAIAQGHDGKPALGGADIRLLFGPIPLVVAALGYGGPAWLFGVLLLGQVFGFTWWKYVNRKTGLTHGYPLVAAMTYSGVAVLCILIVLTLLGISI